jgi:hypothetical protein
MILVSWTGSWTDVSGPSYRDVTVSKPAGHLEQLPSGSWRVKVYTGTDPLTPSNGLAMAAKGDR